MQSKSCGRRGRMKDKWLLDGNFTWLSGMLSKSYTDELPGSSLIPYFQHLHLMLRVLWRLSHETQTG